jgi:carboxyl-terminal processing protease
MKILLRYSKLILLPLLLIVLGCNPEDDDQNPVKTDEVINKAIFDTMKEWYFWENKLPLTPSVSGFETHTDFLRSIMFRELDRWSYLTTTEAFNAAFTGQASGVHGFSFALDANERMFVAFVFNEGPAGKDGWQRGWQITQINGRSIASFKNSEGRYVFDLGPNEVGVTNTFTFRLPDGTETTRTIAKAAFQTNSVLHKEVYNTNNKKVGYWVYQSFRATAGLTPTRSQEVEDSFNFFQAQGIEELIIDLRYNGGGSVDVTEQILNYIAPASATGKVMYTNRHNGNKFSNNRTVNFNKRGNLNLNRIIFITSRSSASASELLINCLEPYMDVVLIGDKTYGKPVGSFPLARFNRVLSSNNIELVPITFAIANANNKAEYFEGFPVNFAVGDDPSRNWGDLQDPRFNASLEFIRTGAAGSRMNFGYYQPVWEMIDAFEGLEKEFPMY